MNSYVIDASAFTTRSSERHTAGALFAPELIDLEIANMLRKSVLRGERSVAEATELMAGWAANAVQRFAHAPLLQTIWSLRDNITPYDASYVALAMRLEAPLLTADHRLAAAARQYCEVVAV